MSYEIALEYIPMGDDRTIVLAGMYLYDWSYAVKIGLFPGSLPRKSTRTVVGNPNDFRHLRLIHQLGESSVFDLITPIAHISSAEVVFSQEERFANGTQTIFEVFKLNLVLRTILPDDGITVLQLMLKHHGQELGLTDYRATDLYAATVYETIGGPLIEDKKGDTP